MGSAERALHLKRLKEGVPEPLIQRAEELYFSVYAKGSQKRDESKLKHFIVATVERKSYTVADKKIHPEKDSSPAIPSLRTVEILREKVESAVISICQKLTDIYKKSGHLEPSSAMRCVLIGAKEQPPPSTIGVSSDYVMLRPDRKLYVGKTDDLQGWVCAHRSKGGMQNSLSLYFLVAGKSIACQLETLLINQLPSRGFYLTNLADGKHRNFGTSNFVEKEALVG